MKIFLLGMPASGKSTLGRLLASRLNYQFTDLDTLIEESKGMSIPQIFGRFGENAFREIESRSLKDHCETHDRFVMATGGGTPCFYDNMDFMNNQGVTIYLDETLDRIMQRIQSDPAQRPLFSTRFDKAELKIMKDQRKFFYEQSRIKIKRDNIDISDVVSSLTHIL